MKKTININFQGQLITIEETAYHLLNQYIESLKEYFSRETDGNEIVNDIENRIAELFGNRLKHGISCITDEDVTAIIDTIGRVEDFDTEFSDFDDEIATSASSERGNNDTPPPLPEKEATKKLYRKSNDRILGGVCSGLAHYLKIDPVFVRLGFVFLSSLFFWIYIIMWIILPKKELPNNVSKRLYRNPNDRFIGGVCGGIAAYFKIDTWIPRLIFLLPIIFNTFGLITIPTFNIFNHALFNSSFPFFINSGLNVSFAGIYLILWIIVPKAVTVKQKLEMMGEEEYLRSIRETVSDNVAQAKSSRATNVASSTTQNVYEPTVSSDVKNSYSNGQKTMAKGESCDSKNENITPPPHNYNRDELYSAPQRSGCLNLLVGVLKIAFFGIVGIVAASFMVSLITLIFAGTKLIPLQTLFIDSGFETTLLWVTIVLTLLLPFIGVIIWLARRIMKAKSRPIIGFIIAILWVVGLIAGLTLGFRITRKFYVESLQETNIELTSPSNNKLYVDMARYSDDYFSVTSGSDIFVLDSDYRGGDIDKLPFYNIEEDSLLFKNIDLRIRTSSDTLFHVKTIYSSFEKSYKRAKANLKEFDFTLQQNDSVLWIPQFFKTPKEQGFRNQFIVVEIFVPTGAKLQISENLEDYQNAISSKTLRKRYGREYGYRNSLKWNPGKEYIIEEKNLKETSLLNDTI